MSNRFMFLPVPILKKQMIEEIRKCNDFTAKYGIQLSDKDIHTLVENRKEALESSGRIEFGGGILKKLLLEFADSPYIDQDNYVSTLMELQECFYYFKNESLEELTDDELIHLMKEHFDDECQGSVEFLQSTFLENTCRDVRYDSEDYGDMDGYEDNYIDFYDGDREYE
ncbi:MAG TPA: DUF6323 family protein [Mobilitalea sp.]|nr:DUF6323 family protein [Mobilitalea sp.]